MRADAGVLGADRKRRSQLIRQVIAAVRVGWHCEREGVKPLLLGAPRRERGLHLRRGAFDANLAKIALAKSFGASTLQIFTKIRIPMAMPMIIVGLMVGSIFGLLTTIGAEMVGGAEGLGNRLTYYSALIRMPQFFAIILILAILGISIYVFFFWLGKKWASWEA